jgi:hypothetical protein
LEHQYSLIECFHPPDDYNTEVADNLAVVDVGTADDAAAAAAAGDGDAVVQRGHLQGVCHLLDCDLQNITENTPTLNVFKDKKHVTSLRVQYATGCDVFSAYMSALSHLPALVFMSLDITPQPSPYNVTTGPHCLHTVHGRRPNKCNQTVAWKIPSYYSSSEDRAQHNKHEISHRKLTFYTS